MQSKQDRCRDLLRVVNGAIRQPYGQDSYRELLQHLSVEIDELVAIQLKSPVTLTLERDVACYRQLYPQYFPCLISTLPNELLSEVFIRCILPYSDLRAASRRATDLRLVCWRWRRVVDRTPILWTRMCSAPSRGQDHLLQYVRRSGALGLAILHLQKEPSSSVLSEVFSVLAPHSERWMELFFRVSWHSMVEKLPTLRLPRLQRVTLIICGAIREDGLRWLTGASALHHLTLACRRSLPSPSAEVVLPHLPSLRVLEIDGLLGVSTRCMLEPLRSCPSLQCLRLHAFQHLGAGSLEGLSMVELPTLRHMHLDCDAVSVLTLITAPALDELVIACVHDGRSLYRILSIFLRSQDRAFSLQTLGLTNIYSGFPAATAEFVRCLSLLESLQSLRVSAYSQSHLGGTDLFRLLTYRHSKRTLLPKLTSLRYKSLLTCMSVTDRHAWEAMKFSRASEINTGTTYVAALDAIEVNIT
ncbi:hypothetical protein EV122DRAFT_255691 [Schizophyllum commune]